MPAACVRSFLALGLVTSSLACGPTGASDGGETETGDGDGDGDDTGCDRVEGEQPVWALRCGGPSHDRAVGVGVDANDNVLLGFDLRTIEPVVPTPMRIGEFTIEPGERSDIVLVSLDPGGEPRWLRHFGGAGDQYLGSAHACADGLAITGSIEGAVDLGDGPIEGEFVAVFDGDGELVWARTVELTGEFPYATVLAGTCNAAGSLFVTGRMREGVDFGGGVLTPSQLFDGFVAGYSPTGEHLFSRTLGNIDGSYVSGRAIAVTPDDAFVVVGAFDRSVDPGGGPLVADGDDVLIVKYGVDGSHLWSRQIGPDGLQYGDAVAVAADGTIAVAGVFLDTIEIGADTHQNVFPNADEEVYGTLYDGFLATLDSDGTPIWSTTVASMLDDRIRDLHYDGDGALVLGATLDQQATIRVYQGGVETWTWAADLTDNDGVAPRIAVAPSGAVVLAGGPRGELDLGTGLLPARGEPDLLVARLVPGR